MRIVYTDAPALPVVGMFFRTAAALFALTLAAMPSVARIPSGPPPATRSQTPGVGVAGSQLSSSSRSVEVDPAFAYYSGRSDESIAAEIAAQGYEVVRYEVTTDSAIRRGLIDAYHRHGIRVWYVTFLNGTYSRADLPSGWQKWKMVNRSDLTGKPVNAGYDFFCLNNPAYRAWKAAKIVATLRSFPFDGVDLKEPFWPDYPGRDAPTFGCFCAECHKTFGHDLPDILHADSERAPERNPDLWQKWLQFRRDSLVSDLNEIVNGPNGIRKNCPGIAVDIWSLALLGPDGSRHIRDDSGEDAVQLARTLRPDALCLETHWPDWGRADLAGEYVAGYKHYLDEIHHAGLTLPVFVETDIGSLKSSRRGSDWIRRFDLACAAAGFAPAVLYEYSIGGRFYREPIRIAAVRRTTKGIELIFDRRPDSAEAARRERYAVSAGSIDAVSIDGATVELRIKGLGSGQRCVLSVPRLSDSPSTRLFPGGPPIISSPVKVSVPALNELMKLGARPGG